MRPRNYRYLEWLSSRFNIVGNFIDKNPFNGKFLLLERKTSIVQRHMNSAHVVCYPLTEKLFNPEWIGLLRRNQLADWLELSRMNGFVDIREDLGNNTIDSYFQIVFYLPSNSAHIITSSNPGPFVSTLMKTIDMRNQQRVIDQYQKSKEQQIHEMINDLTAKYTKFSAIIKNFEKAIIGEEYEDINDSSVIESRRKTNVKLIET